MAFKLPEKKVTVKPNLENPGWIKNPKHAAHFKIEGSYEAYPITMDRSGKFKNVLTKEEKETLEEMLGIELNVYREGGYLRTRYVRLNGKDPKELDLSDPTDYIDYKILLTASDRIAPSVKDRKKKETYKYYIEDADEVASMQSEKASIVKTAWSSYGKMEGDKNKLISFLKVYSTAKRKPSVRITADIKMDYLQAQVSEIVENEMRDFVDLITNPDFDTMFLIAEALETGVIKREGTKYFLEDGDPIGNNFKEAITFLKAPINSDIALSLEEKIKLRQ